MVSWKKNGKNREGGGSSHFLLEGIMECDLRGGYPVCGRLSTPPAAIVIHKKYPDGDRNHKEAGERYQGYQENRSLLVA